MNQGEDIRERIQSDPRASAETATRVLELLDQWEREDQTNDPEEFERRRKDFEEFKNAINANHSSKRTVYP